MQQASSQGHGAPLIAAQEPLLALLTPSARSLCTPRHAPLSKRVHNSGTGPLLTHSSLQLVLACAALLGSALLLIVILVILLAIAAGRNLERSLGVVLHVERQLLQRRNGSRGGGRGRFRELERGLGSGKGRGEGRRDREGGEGLGCRPGLRLGAGHAWVSGPLLPSSTPANQQHPCTG